MAMREAREAGSKANLSTEGTKIVELVSGALARQLGNKTTELSQQLDKSIGNIKGKVEAHSVALARLTTFVAD